MKLLKMAASWCGPCKALSMTLKSVNHPLVDTMEEVDIDADVTMAKKYNVRSVPTLIIVDGEGHEIRRINGAVNKPTLMEFLA